MFYGLDWFATVSPTVRLIGNTFGREKAGIVYGWVFAAHQLGGASAAFFGGLLRVNFGSYTEAFMLSGLLCFAGRHHGAVHRRRPAGHAAGRRHRVARGIKGDCRDSAISTKMASRRLGERA